MSTSAAAPALPTSLPKRILALIPGLVLLAAVGYAGKLIEQAILAWSKSHHTPLPDIEFVLWAIVIGLIIANTTGLPRIFEPGVATYEFWLKTGIVLLGSRFLLGDVLHLGGISLLLVAIAITLSLTFMQVRIQTQAQTHKLVGHRLIHLRRVCNHCRKALHRRR